MVRFIAIEKAQALTPPEQWADVRRALDGPIAAETLSLILEDNGVPLSATTIKAYRRYTRRIKETSNGTD